MLSPAVRKIQRAGSAAGWYLRRRGHADHTYFAAAEKRRASREHRDRYARGRIIFLWYSSTPVYSHTAPSTGGARDRSTPTYTQGTREQSPTRTSRIRDACLARGNMILRGGLWTSLKVCAVLLVGFLELSAALLLSANVSTTVYGDGQQSPVVVLRAGSSGIFEALSPSELGIFAEDPSWASKVGHACILFLYHQYTPQVGHTRIAPFHVLEFSEISKGLPTVVYMGDDLRAQVRVQEIRGKRVKRTTTHMHTTTRSYRARWEGENNMLTLELPLATTAVYRGVNFVPRAAAVVHVVAPHKKSRCCAMLHNRLRDDTHDPRLCSTSSSLR